MLKRDSFPFDFISHSGNNAKVFRREVVHRVSSFFLFFSSFVLTCREVNRCPFILQFTTLDYVPTNTNRVFEMNNNFIIFRVASQTC